MQSATRQFICRHFICHQFTCRHAAHRLYRLACAACLVQFSAAAGAAQIYTCTDAEGRQTYTDRGCPGQREYAPPQTPSVTFTPMAESDKQRLRDAERQQAQMRQIQQRARARRHTQAMQQRAERKQMCASATQALKKLLAKRRKGYPLNRQRQLDEEEAALKSSKRANC